MNETKERFRREFQDGTLHDLWKDVGSGDGFLARWAGHRMAVALKAVDAIALARNARALDIGIGSGSLLDALAGRGCLAFGADFSISIIRMVRERLSGRLSGPADRLVLADVESLPMKDGAFDLVTCLGVFEYLSGDDGAFREIYRILRPGGHVVLAVASYHRIGNLKMLALRKIARARRRPAVKNDHGGDAPEFPGEHLLKRGVRMLKPADIRRNARRTGFEVKSLVSFGGKVFGRYLPLRMSIPGIVHIGDQCMLVLKRPV